MAEVILPYKYTPRPYQLNVLRAKDRGAKRLVTVWHRRSGKEKTFLNMTIKAAFERVGAYFYFFPTYAQAKKAIWDGADREGFPFLGHFPPEIIKQKNESELKIKLVNGSLFQLIGTDNIASIMSTNPIGCVFAEYSLQDPKAWDYVRPILRENGGWAAFDYTPRGNNHGHALYQLARRLMLAGDKDWFCELLTVDHTGVISAADIQKERDEGMDEEMVQQEYYCSFEGAQQGAYYAKQMNDVERSGRIVKGLYDPGIGVETWWDIGVGDTNAIWFTQTVGREVHLIDYLEDSGWAVDHYARELQKKDYIYLAHHGPHDLEGREWGNSKDGRALTKKESAKAAGIDFEIVPNIGIDDGINAARGFFHRCWFDMDLTERGRLALTSYHKTWDDKRKVFSSVPYHDWASNGSDAFRYLAVGHKITTTRKKIERAAPRVSTSSTSWMAN